MMYEMGVKNAAPMCMMRQVAHVQRSGGRKKPDIFIYFLATLVALHFTPVSRSVSRSFGLA